MSEAEGILRGDRGALARGLSRIESGDGAAALLDGIWKATGRARRIGVTGPPGVGKSTLVAGLVRLARAAGRTVGVIAVDPSSALTGGALLGDRHRMSREAFDEGVFVRSLASRGTLGGLSRAAPAALDLLDAFGLELILAETVGVGQSELEVAATTDTVAVVLSPESGDAVQVMKAGLLEIADVLCVNKADRAGADELALALESMLDRRGPAAWRPPVVKTNALDGADALQAALDAHGDWLGAEGRLAARRRAGLARRLRSLVAGLLAERLLAGRDALLAGEAEAVARGERSILGAADRALAEIVP